VVYTAAAGLPRPAGRGEDVRRAVELHIAERARDGTQRQREVARKLLN
jgi:hypothetical protein